MRPRAFITGGSGLLGLNIILQKSSNFDFYVLEHDRAINLPNINIVKADLADMSSINAMLKLYKPQVVFHSAGMTNVDRCDAYPDMANFINATLASNLAKASYDLGIKFVHISTDQLFDGKTSYVTEPTPTSPLNAYGYSKALAEEKVAKNNPEALIIRCNFFGWGPSYKASFSDFIFNNLNLNKKIRLADDIFYTPSVMQNLINSINKLIVKDANGIFHVVGSERLSKYEFGIKMANCFNLDINLIERVSWDSLGAQARRPYEMSLSDNKIVEFLGAGLGNADENIQVSKNELDSQLYKKVKSL